MMKPLDNHQCGRVLRFGAFLFGLVSTTCSYYVQIAMGQKLHARTPSALAPGETPRSGCYRKRYKKRSMGQQGGEKMEASTATPNLLASVSISLPACNA
jgi:hypothetical protein